MLAYLSTLFTDNTSCTQPIKVTRKDFNRLKITISDVKKKSRLPVLIGSGVTPSNLHEFLQADGVIVGSQFKKDGHWKNELDFDRVRQFMEVARPI